MDGEQNEKKNVMFIHQFQDFCASTSLHGVKNVFESGKTRIGRYIWIFLVLVVTIGFTAQFFLNIQMYLQYETFISVNIEEREQLHMPSLTICNSNALKRSVIKAIDPNMIEGFEQFMEIIYGLRTNTTITRTDAMRNYTMFGFYKLAGHKKEDFFVWCSFGQTIINCSDYITGISTNAGHCYTFNSKKSISRNGNLTMSEPGPYDGLNLILDIEPDDYIVSNGFGEGIRFIIHEPDTVPIINTGSYFAGPGQEVYFSLTETHTTYLQPPYSKRECVPENELLQRGQELGLDAPYSEEGCLSTCYKSTVYDCPHCSATGTDKPQCTMYESLQCGADNGVTVQRKEACVCPHKCKTVSFSASNTQTNIPSNFILRLAQKYNWTVKSRADIQRRFILIRVYFDTNVTTSVAERAAVILIETLADIGGTMGLYLGASILTITEILEFGVLYFYQGIIMRLKHARNKKDTAARPDQNNICTIRDKNYRPSTIVSRYSTAKDYNLEAFDNGLYDAF